MRLSAARPGLALMYQHAPPACTAATLCCPDQLPSVSVGVPRYTGSRWPGGGSQGAASGGGEHNSLGCLYAATDNWAGTEGGRHSEGPAVRDGGGQGWAARPH